jgi:hypothetical protein
VSNEQLTSGPTELFRQILEVSLPRQPEFYVSLGRHLRTIPSFLLAPFPPPPHLPKFRPSISLEIWKPKKKTKLNETNRLNKNVCLCDCVCVCARVRERVCVRIRDRNTHPIYVDTCDQRSI